MVKLSINLDEVEGSSFEIIDAGKYNAKVADIIEKDSSKGSPMLVWDWEIVGGDFAGITVKSYTTLQEHALFGLKEHLAAFGVEGDLAGFETDSMIGKTAQITVTKNMIVSNETKEDMEVNRVTRINPAAKKGRSPKIKGKVQDDSQIPL